LGQTDRHIKIYTICRETPMPVMIDCICNDNLKSLVIEGDPTKAELEEIWDNLYIEFCDLIGNSEGLRLAKDIKYLESKLDICKLCLYCLKIDYNADCVKILQDFGYRRKFNPEDPESYTNDIKGVEIGLGSIVIAIRQAKIYYDAEKPLHPKKLSADEYYEILDSINNYYKYHVSMNDLSAYDFAIHYRNFKKEIERK
jgi:hypothetical protein